VIKAKSFTIDGEAVVLGPDGLSRFEELSRREAARTAILYAFDLIEYDGEDLRNHPFLDSKAALARLLCDAKAGILLNEHIVEHGPIVFAHAAGLALSVEEGRWRLPVRPELRLDQGPQSRQHRRIAGAQRDLESTSLRQRPSAITRRKSKFGACRVRRLEARGSPRGCQAGSEPRAGHVAGTHYGRGLNTRYYLTVFDRPSSHARFCGGKRSRRTMKQGTGHEVDGVEAMTCRKSEVTRDDLKRRWSQLVTECERMVMHYLGTNR
jgi:hypothetical protein